MVQNHMTLYITRFTHDSFLTLRWKEAGDKHSQKKCQVFFWGSISIRALQAVQTDSSGATL